MDRDEVMGELQRIDGRVLAAMLKMGAEAVILASLADRGLNSEARWVGFDKAITLNGVIR